MMVAWIALGLTLPFYIVIALCFRHAWRLVRTQRQAMKLLREQAEKLNQG